MRIELTLPGRWVMEAACDPGDDTTLFPEKGGGALIAHAKALCHQCPVSTPCLQYALDNDEAHGIWAGTTPDERQEMRKRARA